MKKLIRRLIRQTCVTDNNLVEGSLKLPLLSVPKGKTWHHGRLLLSKQSKAVTIPRQQPTAGGWGYERDGQKETGPKETRQKETGQKVLYLGQKVHVTLAAPSNIKV